eukprot:m.166916 g.166916  ORF g.166916 m.166916 type:complete len:51 (-) comp17760_c0_seq4:104-256(-)
MLSDDRHTTAAERSLLSSASETTQQHIKQFLTAVLTLDRSFDLLIALQLS